MTDDKRIRQRFLARLMSGIGHDFNNILAGIIGNVTLVQADLKADDPARPHLDRVLQSCDRAERLIGQLVSLADAGSSGRKSTPLADLIHRAAPLALMGSKAGYHYRQPDDLWPVRVDSGRVCLGLINALMTADADLPSGGHIDLDAANVRLTEDQVGRLEAGRYVRLTISEAGLGWPPEILDRVFEPQPEEDDRPNLVVLLEAVKKQSGWVAVDSAPGRGVEITIHLPAAQSPPYPPPVGPKGDSISLQEAPGRVLVVDDDPAIRETASAMLARLGREVQTVEDGLAAIRAIKQARREGHPFELVLIDLTVPGGLGGAEAAAKLTQLDPDLRLVASSGYISDPAMTDPQGHGFRAALAKPYSLDEMGRLLTELSADD